MTMTASTSSSRRMPSAFTLTELLIVMGVIAALSVLTLVSVRSIIQGAQLASATNTVTASLDSARSMAMKYNTVVVLVFRPRFAGDGEQVVDAVIARWTGESLFVLGTGGNPSRTYDRFVPVFDVPIRSLPRGIKVAGPSYGNVVLGDKADFLWITQTHLPAIDQDNPQAAGSEVPGGIIGVMFGADGTTISVNPRTDAAGLFLDFDDSGGQRWLAELDLPAPVLETDLFREQDEPMVQVVPFLAVYDDDEARALKTGEWNDLTVYQRDLVGDPNDPDLYPGYITSNANRIHFNRYSGVVMR